MEVDKAIQIADLVPESVSGGRGSRLGHIDACRGVTMLLVLYAHLEVLGLGVTTDLNWFFMLFRMPLFIFVSGYLAFSTAIDRDAARRRSRNRIVRQLYPTLLFWLGYIFLIVSWQEPGGVNMSAEIAEHSKRGYWFTFVLVELFFLSLPLLRAVNKYGMSRKRTTWLLAGAMGVVLAGRVALWVLKNRYHTVEVVADTFCLSLLFHNGFFFFLGMLARNYEEEFERMCSKGATFAAAFGVYMLVAVFFSDNKYLQIVELIVCGTAGTVAVYSFFSILEKIARRRAENSAVGGSAKREGRLAAKLLGWLKAIGGSTLELYMLHYFLLAMCTGALKEWGWVRGVLNTWLEFPVFIALSIAMAVVLLMVKSMLKRSGVHRYLFPDKKMVGILTAYWGKCVEKLLPLQRL